MTPTRLYVGCFNGKLYCLDKSGNKVWDYQTHYYIKDAPAVSGDTVVISSRDEGIYGLRDLGASCAFLWKNRVKEFGEYVPGSVGRCSPIIVNGYVFTNSAEAELGHFTRALSLSTGVSQDIPDGSNFNTTGFAAAASGEVLSNMVLYASAPPSRTSQKSGYYIRYCRSNAAPVVIGNYYVFHSSFHPRGIYLMDPGTTTARDSLAMDGYTVASSFAASDSVIFFGTYEGFLLGMGNGNPVVCSGNPGQIVINPVSAVPNPFNPSTCIRFALAKSTDVRVRVFNASGRLAWEKRMPMDRGYRSIIWNGTDSRGRPLPSGLYIVRTRIADRVYTTKITLMK
jgi:outer membrane protein assembly factor BamB